MLATNCEIVMNESLRKIFLFFPLLNVEVEPTIYFPFLTWIPKKHMHMGNKHDETSKPKL